ncbi:hypothetical protein U1P98_04335 [Lysinibacillus irui]|uniref:DUF6877 domain-containing protein n=1 Tax=Lysinibacillus irui TaxID=2998077 RepID=A0ABU5NHK5_9BACI|nr:DUF6877 family protein [Lysinibacillus irui]MEA0552937.1 hypothetical protein [Lysinibacillus irui]MEA0975517.1 hypothetical protein [Lysinibacillus irui]MEA1041671.1 hypothetical protein [Lysinibacillus irui]
MSRHEEHMKIRNHFTRVAQAKGTFTNGTDQALIRAVTHDKVAKRINQLVSEYQFPLPVLQDVQKRLSDSNCTHYAMQQLRYLENNVHAGIATKREDSNK